MKPFTNITNYGAGDIIQAFLLLEEALPTKEELEQVKDKKIFTLYTAIDFLLEDRLREPRRERTRLW